MVLSERRNGVGKKEEEKEESWVPKRHTFSTVETENFTAFKVFCNCK
jgi:hypothetical protein